MRDKVIMKGRKFNDKPLILNSFSKDNNIQGNGKKFRVFKAVFLLILELCKNINFETNIFPQIPKSIVSKRFLKLTKML